jgi:hypothetical protein
MMKPTTKEGKNMRRADLASLHQPSTVWKIILNQTVMKTHKARYAVIRTPHPISLLG